MAVHHNRPICNGTAFRDGKLYVFQRDRGIIVISQWPNMRAWRKTPKGRVWKHIRPEMRIVKSNEGWSCVWGYREPRQRDWAHHSDWVEIDPARAPTLCEPVPFEDRPFESCPAFENDDPLELEVWKRRAYLDHAQEIDDRNNAEYLKSIPDEILTPVSRFQNRHWHLLNLVARCPGALDLMRSTPALALALSSPWVFRKNPPSRPLRAARSLVRKPQIEIAAWLGFPKAWSVIKILRKLPPEECTVLNLLRLRGLFETHLKVLQQLPSLNASIIRLLEGERDWYRISRVFLRQLVSQPDLLDRSLELLQVIQGMQARIRITRTIVLHSFKRLARLHEELTEMWVCLDHKALFAHQLPPPPLTVTNPFVEVEPLRTNTDLFREGRTQKNCVRSYGRLIQRGVVHVYRLLAPERATLAVKLEPDGKWVLNQIKAYGNSEVSPTTLAAVLEWIDGCTAVPEQDQANCPF